MFVRRALGQFTSPGRLAPIGAIAENFEFLGYAVVGAFAITWTATLVLTHRQVTPHHAPVNRAVP